MVITMPELSSNPFFHSLGMEESKILNEYLSEHIKKIPSELRDKFTNKYDDIISFVEDYEKGDHPNDPSEMDDIYEKAFIAIGKIYQFIFRYVSALEGPASPYEVNFEKRCELVSELLPIKKEEIEGYMGNFKYFHLFRCIYDAIYKKPELANYSLSTFDSAITDFERMVIKVIHILKLFVPYTYYESTYLYDFTTRKLASEVIVHDKLTNRICNDEKIEGMTTYLAAKIISIAYNYKMEETGTGGRKEYRLLRRRMVTREELK